MAKILYIEDIEDNLTLVQKLIISHGHEFLWANNAELGLDMSLEAQPDLILLENIHEKDPHLPDFRALAYLDNFSRIEMRR